MADFQWVETNTRSAFPENAVEGGRDKDGSTIYVGLATHEGDEIPAKVIPARQVAYIPYNGKEVTVSNYKVLVRKDFRWVPTSGGNIPPDAVAAGRTGSGETLYVGRANHDGALVVGKVHPSHGVLYVPFKWEEHGYKDYEILVYN